MKPRVYIDTSVIGGCFDEEFRLWSEKLFDEFRAGTKVVSWNFQQIVNLNRIRAFDAVNLRLGYQILEIRSPREVVNEKDV